MSSHIPAYLCYSTTLSLHLLTVSFLEHVITSDNTNHEFLHGGEPCFPHFSRTDSSQSLLHGNLRKWWKGVWSLTRPVLQKLLMVETKPHVWSLVTALQPWIKSTRLLLAADIQISSRTPSTYKYVHIVYVAPWWILVSSTSISKSYRDIFLLYMLVVVSSPLLTCNLCCIRAPELTLHSFLGCLTN